MRKPTITTQSAPQSAPEQKAAAPARKGGLGRGLSALIPQAAQAASPRPAQLPEPDTTQPSVYAPSALQPQPATISSADAHLKHIPIKSISLNPNQPRKTFGEAELADLRTSIAAYGVLQPIVVRLVSGRGIASYELIAGERRFRAATAAGLTEIPAVIREDVDDKDSLALALIENIQRENLNAIETAQAYDELLHNYNLTQTELAQALGKSQPQVANTLRLLNLPSEIQESVRSGRISEGHAKVILSVVDRSGMLALWTTILAQDLTVRQAEAAASKMRSELASPTSPRRILASREPDEHLTEVGRKISLHLGTKVRVLPGRGQKGSIEISYYNLDQLEGLIERLSDR